MISPSTKDIVKIVRSYAYMKGMSMSEFAKSAGVSKAWISKLKNEDDREISLHVAQQLLEAAGYVIVVKHQSKVTDSDKEGVTSVKDTELDRKDKENMEVNKLIDKNKKLLDNDNQDQNQVKTQGFSKKLRNILSNIKN